jgi:hypothetical protein
MTFQLDTSGRYHLQARVLCPAPGGNGPRDWTTQETFADKTAALHARLDRKRTHPSYKWRVFDVEADHEPGRGVAMTPFATGYTEAMRESLPAEHRDAPLAPATLARIIADCERFKALGEREHFENIDNTAKHGARLWWAVSRGIYRLDGFPPLTTTLSDSGQVVFGEEKQ